MKKNKWVSALLAVSLIGSAQAMTLEQVVSDAVIHSPEFRAEVKRRNSFEAEVRAARSAYLPSVDLLSGIGYEEVNNPGIDNFGDGLTRREASIRLTQNLFNGFGTRNEVKRLENRLKSQSYRSVAIANTVALAMTEAYIDLLREQDLLRLAQDNTTTHRQILEQIIERHNAGIGDSVEVDQARARLALAESNFAAVQNNYHDAKTRFRRILGRNPDNILVRPVFNLELPEQLEQATHIALQDHPTLRSAIWDVAETHSQYKAANRFNYPSFDFELERTFDRNVAGVEGRSDNFQAMLRMRYNLFSGGRHSAERHQAISAHHESAEIRNNTRRQIIEDLRYAWNAKTHVGHQLGFIEQHIKLTRDTLIGYRQQFTLGRRSLLDLLNTENEYYSATQNLIASEYELLKSKYRILSSMGHLLASLGVNYGFIQESDYTLLADVEEIDFHAPAPQTAAEYITFAETLEASQAKPTAADAAPTMTDPRLAAIMQKPEQHFVLQIFADQDRERVESFIANQSQPDDFTLLPTRYDDTPWYLVIYGDYDSSQAAQEAISSLPNSLQRLQPWARSYRVMQRLIQKGLD